MAGADYLDLIFPNEYGRRDIGVLRYSYTRGGMACTLHPEAAVTRVRDGQGTYIEDREGANLYQCEDCGASTWGDTY